MVLIMMLQAKNKKGVRLVALSPKFYENRGKFLKVERNNNFREIGGKIDTGKIGKKYLKFVVDD